MKRTWASILLGLTITWQGLHVGVQQGAPYDMVLKQWTLNAAVEARVKITNRIGARVTYLRPLFRDVKPKDAVAIGVQVRVF